MANQISVNQGTGNQQITVTSNGNIQVTTSRSVIGTLANVGHANTANTVTNNAQPNITSVGTMTGLTSTGNISAPFFIGNVVGNISGNIVVPGSNQAVLYNNSGNAGASDAFKFNQASNTVTLIGNITANYFIGNGSQLTGITATDANTANFANYAGNAFSVSGSNVVGAVGLATFAGTANAVAGANVSGTVANATFATTAGSANTVAGANVTGTVANATYALTAGSANSATVANSANSVAGANVTGTVANATYATSAGSATTAGSTTTASTITTNTQPNITSTGTLTCLTVNGNITTTNMTVTGNLSVGNLFANNANYANFAGTVITNAQPNITSVGTLTSLDVSGNATIGNITNVDSVTFDTANVGPGAVAQLTWDDGQGTLDLGLKGGNVTAKIAQQEYARVYNAEANTLAKGEVVYVSGAQGNLIKVNRAQANSETTSVGTIGVVAETITAGGEGYIQTTGAMYKLNTNTLTAGNVLYLSPSVAGGYTPTKPVAPDQLVTLGYVERVNATVGRSN